MGLFSKLKFWKKKDIFAEEPRIEPRFEGGSLLNKDENNDHGSLAEERSPLRDIYTPGRKDYQFEEPADENFRKNIGSGSRDRDMDLVLSRLETIKAILDSLDHRMSVIEKKVTEENRRY